MRDLTVPQPLHWHVPFATLVKAATVDVKVAPSTLRSRKLLVHSFIVRDFVLNIVVIPMRVCVFAFFALLRVCVSVSVVMSV